MIRRFLALLMVAIGVSVLAVPVTAQMPVGTAFTYQGQLKDAGRPYDGNADLIFQLFDAETGGNPVGQTVAISSHPITNGLFTVDLDFGPGVFAGDGRWLEIEVNGVPLLPRQAIRPAPYALFALNAPAGGSSLWQEAAGGIYYNTGDVGIGTTSPLELFHVEKTPVPSTAETVARFSVADAGANYLSIGNASGLDTKFDSMVKSFQVGSAGPALTLEAETNQDGSSNPPVIVMNAKSTSGALGWRPLFGINNNGSEVFRVNQDGDVGIGTTTPSARLHVGGTPGVDGIRFPDGTLQVTAATGGGGGSVWLPSGSDIYYNTGNVGIGTTAPQKRLSVSEDMNIDQNNANDGTLVSGLTFGGGSGEGIASKRTPGDGQYGLDFYTSYQKRMSISQSGDLAIGATMALATDTYGGGTLRIAGPGGLDGGDVGIALRGSSGPSTGGGEIWLYNGVGNTAVELAGDDGDAGGSLVLSNGTSRTVILDASEAGNGHAELELRKSNGATVHQLSASNHMIRTYGSDGTEKMRLWSDGWGGFFLWDSSHDNTVQLTAGNESGGELFLRNGSGTTTITLDADVGGSGRVTTQVLAITGGSDLSEQFDVTGASGRIEPGMVVCIDRYAPGKLVVSSQAYDRTVAGILSGAGGVRTGMMMSQSGSVADGDHPVALSGRVWTWCDASSGAIRPGDLLTTSATLGHAMKVTDHDNANGAILGKAMTTLDKETGLVLVLVSLQ